MNDHQRYSHTRNGNAWNRAERVIASEEKDDSLLTTAYMSGLCGEVDEVEDDE